MCSLHVAAVDGGISLYICCKLVIMLHHIALYFIFEYAKKRGVSSGSHDEFMDYIFGNVEKSLKISVALGKHI